MSSIVTTFARVIFLLMISSAVFAQPSKGTDSLHDGFSALLNEHVSDGVVNYSGFKNNTQFKDYLELLKTTNPDSFQTREQKLAFWINAYNALAIKGILDGLSPGSFFGRISYFKTTDYEVGGRKINLYDLERDIIIPFEEPRIHFAIICASVSCPKLRSEAYRASTLENQLQDNALDFINDDSKNNFDAAKKRANISKIFDWFEKDFKAHSGSVQTYLSQFVSHDEIREGLKNKQYKVKHLKYDWNLNGSPPN